MGVLSTVWSAISGPLIVLLLLLAHVTFRVTMETPQPIKVDDFPSGTTKEAKDAIIANRKVIIKEVLEAWNGRPSKTFLTKHFTEDVELEDPLQKWMGRQELQHVMDLCERTVVGNDIAINGEYHGVHEIILDWSHNFQTKWFPSYPLKMQMRTTLFLEPPATKGGQEKVFRVMEEWNGNQLLNEKTTFPILGRIHQKMRRFMGYCIAAAVEKGWM